MTIAISAISNDSTQAWRSRISVAFRADRRTTMASSSREWQGGRWSIILSTDVTHAGIPHGRPGRVRGQASSRKGTGDPEPDRTLKQNPARLLGCRRSGNAYLV
jgi:hypothetical protein